MLQKKWIFPFSYVLEHFSILKTEQREINTKLLVAYTLCAFQAFLFLLQEISNKTKCNLTRGSQHTLAKEKG